MSDTNGQLYPYGIFQNWGTDAETETLAEVWLFTLTAIDSIPFFREFGSILPSQENAPNKAQTLIAARLSTANSLAQYAEIASPKRAALTAYDLIDFDEDVEGDADFSLTYLRLANNNPVSVSA